MEHEKMFEKATRLKLRFPAKGSISVEDLWDLSLKDLDAAFKVLNAKAKETKEESLLETKNKEDEILELKIKIIRYIVDVKRKEMDAAKKAAQDKVTEQKILEEIERRKEQSYQNMSDEELQKALAKIQGK